MEREEVAKSNKFKVINKYYLKNPIMADKERGLPHTNTWFHLLDTTTHRPKLGVNTEPLNKSAQQLQKQEQGTVILLHFFI